MGRTQNVCYQDIWGNTYTVGVNEAVVTYCLDQGYSENTAIFMASLQPIHDDMASRLMEDHEYAARYIADAKRAVITTGTFGDEYVGVRKAEEILKNQDEFISALEGVRMYLDHSHPELNKKYTEEEKIGLIITSCQMALSVFPCWKIIGFEK